MPMTTGITTVSIMHILLTNYLESVRKLVEKKDMICNVIFCQFKMITTPREIWDMLH